MKLSLHRDGGFDDDETSCFIEGMGSGMNIYIPFIIITPKIKDIEVNEYQLFLFGLKLFTL